MFKRYDYVGFLYKKEYQALSLDKFNLEYGDILDKIPFAYGETEEKAINRLKNKLKGVKALSATNFVGHCRYCGRPIVEGEYTSFDSQILGSRFNKTSISPGTWHLHKNCYISVNKLHGFSRNMILYLSTNKVPWTMHKFPKILYICDKKNVRTYSNAEKTLYILYNYKEAKTVYSIRGNLTAREIEQLANMIKLIDKSGVSM